MRKEYNVLKVYFKFNIYAGLIIAIVEIANYTSLGDVTGMKLSLSRIDMILLLFLQTVTIAMAYPLFLWTKSKRIKACPGFDFRFEVHRGRMHRFMLILLIANIIFSYKTGNGVLGRTVTSKFSFLFNIIQVAPLFPVYYVCARDSKKLVYWFNIILYSAFRFMCGWSSHILLIVILEMFLRIKHGRQKLLVKTMLRLNDLLVITMFIAGSWLYCFIYPFKFTIRYGAPLSSVAPLEFSKGMANLLSRFTNIPVTIAAVQNHAVMAELYQKQRKLFWEVESILSPLLPRFLMPNKEYRSFSNIVQWAVYPDLSKNTSTGYNVFVYWLNILEADAACFFVAVIVFTILFVLTKSIIFSFDNGSGDVEILYFLFLVEVLSTASLPAVFGYGYVPLMYSIPVMMVLGVIKMKKKPVEMSAALYSGTRNGAHKCLSDCVGFSKKGVMLKALFITFNGIKDKEYGGAKCTVRNYNALRQFADVDVFHIKKISTLKSVQSITQGVFPPVLNADIRKIESMLSAGNYDFVFLDSSLFGCIAKMSKKKGVPVVVHFHNCESDYIRVRFGRKRTIRAMIYQRLADKEEKTAVENADYTMVLTERDKRRIENLYHVKVDAVIPVGIIDAFKGNRERSGEYCLLFGPLGTANEEGFSWFVRNVSPYLRCGTVVAGKGFEKYKSVWDSDKVRVKGFVDDISEVYDGAVCVAIPMLSGGGMKLKTAEALMFGKYIFGTEEAFVGYDFETEKVGGQCDSSEEFIDAINGFLDRNEASFNSYARGLYLEKYSLDAGIREFEKLKCFIDGKKSCL